MDPVPPLSSEGPAQAGRMVLAPPEEVAIARCCEERVVIAELLELDGRQILEIGCGRAELTRELAQGGPGRQLLALEVDEVQHALNLEITDLPNVRFELAGAQALPAADQSLDVVLLFKSLHHVPAAQLDQSLREVARVLRPGGFAYVSEPLFRGEFNQVLRLFHDESQARREAFEAVRRAVRSGALELVSQTFFEVLETFRDYAHFEQRILGATHTEFRLSAATERAVRARFERSAAPGGFSFRKPMRVDLLRRPDRRKPGPAVPA